MARSVDEKYNYNYQRWDDNNFSAGYCMGVTNYRAYVKASDKASFKQYADSFWQLARKGDELAKGFVAGYRDAANERKCQKQTTSSRS